MRRNRGTGARQRRRLEGSDVAELFRMRAAGVSLRRIAVKFQVTHRTVMNILSGRIYRDYRWKIAARAWNTGKSSLTSSALPVGRGAIVAPLPEMAGAGS